MHLLYIFKCIHVACICMGLQANIIKSMYPNFEIFRTKWKLSKITNVYFCNLIFKKNNNNNNSVYRIFIQHIK